MICLICNREFDEIPNNAVLLQKKFGKWLYQFPDKEVHEFQIVRRKRNWRRSPPRPKPDKPIASKILEKQGEDFQPIEFHSIKAAFLRIKQKKEET